MTSHIGVTTVLFDFDGTISTLRAGWEEVMQPFMEECIRGDARLTDEQEQALRREVAAYIDESTGIQTVYQMRWLAQTVAAKGWNSTVLDEWTYKAEYNRRLLLKVKERVGRLERGELNADDYLMKGSLQFLQELAKRGVSMYVASGTDHGDVVREAEVLGVARFFRQIAGAPEGKAECSKEKVLVDLLDQSGLSGAQLAVIGDGKVEIGLAKERGALAVGLASDEFAREGVNPLKQARLEKAGADWITGDFKQLDEWLNKLFAG